MVRTQVLFEADQYRWLKECARRSGESLSSLVRRHVEAARLRQAEPQDRLLALAGAFVADVEDGSEHHDRYLAEPDWADPDGGGGAS
jgi:hypothetical protein